MTRSLALASLLSLASTLSAQERTRLPDVSATIKGELTLPAPVGTPLFASITESIGQLGAVYQHPLYKGFGLGVGGGMSWFGLEERALAPIVTSGEVRRGRAFGKLSYEHYTTARSFYELSFRAGLSLYRFDCTTCSEQVEQAFHWGFSTAYYLHATDNLAFGLVLGYEQDMRRFAANDLGLEVFPGRREVTEGGNSQFLIVGLSFSTRLRPSPDNGRGW
ncbi:MAG: hypothetical protein R2817_01435 [Flavobacteriales bacterium]